ncbi:MAG: hypothetical protein WBV39_12080 [Rudaea sp.]
MKLQELVFFGITFAPIALAQQSAPTPATVAASAPAAAKQFDFLLGQWELDVHPKISGLAAMIHGTPKLVGTWRAWRTLDGLGIEDELRIVDASGNPIALNRALRIWSGGEARWKILSLDAYHARSSEASGSLQGGELRIDGHFDDAEGKMVLIRTRYYDIGTDSFRMQQDRSEDSGKSWDQAVLTIDAKRTAAVATP